MAVATQSPPDLKPPAHAHASSHAAPITPGKVAMWLFLGTEIMFFTGLIGTYIVLRAGSPGNAYSNLYSPNALILNHRLADREGARLLDAGQDAARVEEVLHTTGGQTVEEAERTVELAKEGGRGVIGNLAPGKAKELVDQLTAAGAKAEPLELKTHSWPAPYDELTNPLAINLTAFNTFILICSSVTMVLSLAGFQSGSQFKGRAFLLATVIIGSIFLSIQVKEYNLLMNAELYPAGISATGHFRPSVSLFASCFFTMTGFHGAHVTAGVITLLCVFLVSLTGRYTATNNSTVELVGLYWHFVDLVWIILFTVVYLI